jgi:ABC-type Fe3+/spermidine/putrescine transport system ATPase subunit
MTRDTQSVTRTNGVGVRLKAISHAYGATEVLSSVDLDVHPGEFMTLLGPSGSGKTTLLRIIGGLVQPLRGQVAIAGRDVTNLPPERRDIGFVFQNYALFPHLTVWNNVAFPLRMRRQSADQIRTAVPRALERVELTGLESRYPGQLSGGQQQRVALARAVVFEPSVLLLDEPLGALDRRLREQLGLELRDLQRSIGLTAVYVTHDQEEAFTLSTRIAVMHRGKVLQVASPLNVYRSPSCRFVAELVGTLNVLPGKVGDTDSNGCVTLHTDRGPDIRASSAAFLKKGARIVCGIRPESLQMEMRPGSPYCLSAQVRTVIFGGSWTRLGLVLGNDIAITAELAGRPMGIEEGKNIFVRYDPAEVLVYPESAS